MPAPRPERELTAAGASRLLEALIDPPNEPPIDPTTPENPTATPPASPPLPPGFSIERELGRGGGGVVYLARKDGSDRRLALKLIRSPSRLAWLELDSLERLHLPCLPRLIDYGNAPDGRLYVATEYVDGLHLDAWCEARLLTLRQRVELLARVARCVQQLHEHGVIHRDLKPSNVIIDSHGDPIIIDLGLALASETAAQAIAVSDSPNEPRAQAPDHSNSPDEPRAQARDHSSPFILGTPAYMSPEQARGERASTRSDVYALGAIAYRLLTGRLPRDLPEPSPALTTRAAFRQALARLATEPARDPRSLPAFAPALRRSRRDALAAILLKACALDPDDRYASAADLADDLDRWARGEWVEAVRPSPLARAARALARHPILTTTAACLIIASGILGGTAVSVRWLLFEPVRIEISTDRTHVILLSRVGGFLHEWRSLIPHGVVDAEFIPASRTPNARPIVLTVIQQPDGHPHLDKQLAVWDARNPAEPLWHTAPAMPGLRAPRVNLPEKTGADLLAMQPDEEAYTCSAFLVADLFPQRPGHEIVISHGMDIDPRCIRVYDLNGRDLYQAWHWGSATPEHFLPRSGLIIFMGCNNQHRWNDLTTVPMNNHMWPIFLMALRPSLDAKLGWVNPGMAEPGHEPEWYRIIEPLEAYARVEFPNLMPRHTLPDQIERFVVRIVTPGSQDIGVSLVIDASGRAHGNEPNDQYRHAVSAGEIEPLPEFDLGPLRDPLPRPPLEPEAPGATTRRSGRIAPHLPASAW